MRPELSAVARRPPDPGHQHSAVQVLVATALLTVGFGLLLVAASWPLPVAGAAGVLAVGYGLVRTLRRRRRTGETRTLCVPRTDVCVAA